MGRSLGTERSPTDPLSRQLVRQTESRMPVERLARNQQAGGRRRANQEDRSRSREGPRPEEVRARRQEQAKPSRRQEEAASRDRASSETARARAEQPGPRGPGQPGESPESASFAESLRKGAQTRPTPGKPGSNDPPGAPVAQSSTVETPVVSAYPAPGATLAPGEGDAGGRTASRPGLASGTGSARPNAPQVAAVAAPGATAGKVPGEVEARGDRPSTEPTTRWSETAEAERASSVLRQFRLHLNPAMRSATINLSPAELGRISIRLNVKDARVRAVVRAESAETLQILERHLPELEASFAQQDLEIDEFDLQLGFGESGTRATPDGERRASRELEEDSNAIEVPIDHPRLARALAQKAGVDTYA